MVRIVPYNYLFPCPWYLISLKYLSPFPLHLINLKYDLPLFYGKKLETMGRTEMKTVKLDLHKKLPWMAALWMSIQRKLSWRMFHALSVRRCCINLLFSIVVMVNSNIRIKEKNLTCFWDINLCWFWDSVLCILFAVLEWGSTQMPCLWKSSPWRFP